MNCGDVFYWNTTHVRGRAERNKYHIFVCDEDWDHDAMFLFINKADIYGTDLEITQAECPCLPLPISYISCVNPAFYTAAEIKGFGTQRLHTLDRACLTRLRDHVIDHEVLEENYRKKIYKALIQAII